MRRELDDAILAALKQRARRGVVDMEGGPRRVARVQPAARATRSRAELRLGFTLPPVVRQVSGLIGNGGFGPGYGLIGILDDLGHHVAVDYLLPRESDPSDPGWPWPERLPAVCHRGCGICSCLDCSHDRAPVIRLDPNGSTAARRSRSERSEIRSQTWLGAWLAGEDMVESGFVPRVVDGRDT